jgi:hypothetical protein
MHSTQRGRQRYECHGCGKQFDDLTGTVFEGHHQPLRVWIMCSYMMGLNLSNQQIAAELDLNKDEAQAMATALREGVEVKKAHHPEREGRGRRGLHRGRPQGASRGGTPTRAQGAAAALERSAWTRHPGGREAARTGPHPT